MKSTLLKNTAHEILNSSFDNGQEMRTTRTSKATLLFGRFESHRTSTRVLELSLDFQLALHSLFLLLTLLFGFDGLYSSRFKRTQGIEPGRVVCLSPDLLIRGVELTLELLPACIADTIWIGRGQLETLPGLVWFGLINMCSFRRHCQNGRRLHFWCR
ncbi:uncharacterized protein BCR38DRAFT_177621 [Pseudomassariella vexata]|uniref:Uncharacterized protein n=1 Tax=Pseudomassariella vexata TaxID=1141098 RepID=A0A1Y2E495_9PEZI|nr:uncharacterized protein BCR38DRAFT_177621 [Pseudomassariella vexata]ORY66339.1 hypothetical protein BCR38DRAFT_177621 [Pseudomassariella vexata]